MPTLDKIFGIRNFLADVIWEKLDSPRRATLHRDSNKAVAAKPTEPGRYDNPRLSGSR